MKRLIILITLMGAIFGCMSANAAETKEPRKVAVQMWSLHNFTLEEALGKIKGMNIDGIECYPGQVLSAKYPKVKVGPAMNAEQREYMKKLLADAGVKMVSFGCTNVKDEAEADAVCQFVKEMGGERVVTESPVYMWQFLDKACEKYGLKFCIHHHATNSSNQYWNAEMVKKLLKNYKNGMANPDVGHWARSGIDPVEGLKTYSGVIGSIHFKNEKEFNKVLGNQCVRAQEGVIDLKKVLKELDAQGYNGFFVIEYESDWDNNIPQIKEYVEFLKKN